MTEDEALRHYDFYLKLSLGGDEEVDIYFDLIGGAHGGWDVSAIDVYHEGHRITGCLDFDFVAEALYENAEKVEELFEDKNDSY